MGLEGMLRKKGAGERRIQIAPFMMLSSKPYVQRADSLHDHVYLPSDMYEEQIAPFVRFIFPAMCRGGGVGGGGRGIGMFRVQIRLFGQPTCSMQLQWTEVTAGDTLDVCTA